MKTIVKTSVVLLITFLAIHWTAGDTPPYLDAQLPIEKRVQGLLSRMSLEEKIEQLSQKDAGGIAMNGDQADPVSLQKLFGDRSPGVLCARFGDDLQQTAHRLVAGHGTCAKRPGWHSGPNG